MAITLNIPPSHHYFFRATTEASTAVSQAGDGISKKRSRTILPLSDSPSLTLESPDLRIIDPEKSAVKSHLRVQNYWIDAVIEKVVNTQFSRGKTHLQGSQAPLGWQAAHFSLAPHTKDDLTQDVIESVIDKGLTPVRSKPFLRARIDLTSPDGKVLQDNHRDPHFVRNFILSKLPSGAEDSSLYGTRFSLSRNATFENPNESNQFDTLLEKAIKPLLKRLQAQRSSGTIDEDDSTQRLVEWLSCYYQTSTANNQQRLEQLDTFFALQFRLNLFEDMYANAEEVPTEKLQEYIAAAKELLDCKTSLLTSLEGTSRCHGIRLVRNDYYYLTMLVRASARGDSPEALESFFRRSSCHFTARPVISSGALKQKYEYFIQEAAAQLDGILTYSDPCSIPGLKTALFGVLVNGVRTAPTQDQLREQIFPIFKVASPYKPKVRRLNFDKENESAQPESPTPFRTTSAAKRLRMTDLASEESL